MQIPTWQSVGVPENVVNFMRTIRASFQLDCLVTQTVFHNYKKLYVSYYCDTCGFVYQPQRSNEEVCSCQNNNCGSKRVRCVQSLKFNVEKKIPYYSRGPKFISNMIRQMNTNFSAYFGNFPERDLDWEWHNGVFHVAFAGGETAADVFPRVAVSKAAILTPYLWDSFYDWKNMSRSDAIDQRFITPLLQQFLPSKDKQ